MLIAYSMPATTIGLYAPGGAWLTTDNGTAMIDGKPARASRFRWRSDAGFVALYADFAATKIRIAALLGIRGVPAGVKTEAVIWQAGLVGPTIVAGSVVRLADGTFASIFVFPEAAPVAVRAEVRITNDLAGATWAVPTTQVDIGELVCMPAVEVMHGMEWSDELLDPSTSSRTIGAQLATSPARAYRRIQAPLEIDSIGKVRGGGLANGMDWNQLRYALAGDARCAVLTRWRTPAGVVDSAELHRTFLYGVARLSAIAHVGGNYYSGAITAEEVPA